MLTALGALRSVARRAPRFLRRNFLAGLACACALVVPAAADEPARSLVLLVDTSTSMDDLMPVVHEGIQTVLEQLRPGDHCMLFAFGDRVRRVADQDVRGPADVEALVQLITEFQPTDRFTDITSALEHGIGALRRDARAHPGRIALLVLLTDGRHNTPNAARSPTFESVAAKFGDFRGGDDWFLHYLVLRPDADDAAARAFVAMLGGVYTLNAEDASVGDALLKMRTSMHATLVDTAGTCSIRPAGTPGWYPAPVGAVFSQAQVIETAPDARAIVAFADVVRVGLGLGTVLEVVRTEWDPFADRGRIHLRVTAGTVEIATGPDAGRWALQIDTPSGTFIPTGTRFRLSVDPGSGAARVSVRRGTVDVQASGETAPQRCGTGQRVDVRADTGSTAPVPLETAGTTASMVWDAALEEDAPLRSIGPRLVAAYWAALRVRLGPLGTDGTWRADLPIPLAGLDPEDIAGVEALVKGSLPEGVSLYATLARPVPIAPHVLSVRVTTAAEYHPREAAEYAIEVVLLTGRNADFARFPVALWTAEGAAPVAGEAPPVVSDGWRAVAGMGAVGVLLMVFVYYRGRAGGGGAAAMGRLLVVGNPIPGEWRQDFIRLGTFFDGGREKTITIGRSRFCDIVLPHESVRDHHCNLILWRRWRRTGVRVAQVKDADILLDRESVQAPREMVDRAQLRVGAFTLQYEDSSAKPQVLVHLKNGLTVRGALHSWDITALSFQLAPDDPDVKLPGGAIPSVPFTDVEDIVMLRMDKTRRRRRSRKTGSHVVVSFPRGRQVRGELWTDYRPDARMFSLFPAEEPEADYMVVVRANAAGLEIDGAPAF